MMCCDNDAPDLSGSNEAAIQQAEIARQQWDNYKTTWQPMLMEQMKDDAARGGRLSDLAEAQQIYELDRSKKFDERYWDTQVPLEDRLISDALKYNEPQERERLAGIAKADVQQAFKNSDDQLTRNLAAYGVNPSAGKFVGLKNATQIARAGMEAGAMNNTREMAREKGRAQLTDAAALLRGLPGFAGQSTQLAQGWGGQGSNMMGMNSMQAGMGVGNQTASMAGGLYGSSSANQRANAVAGNEMQSNAISGIVRGGMALYGMSKGFNPFGAGFADGGPVDADAFYEQQQGMEDELDDPYMLAADDIERTISDAIPEAKKYARGGRVDRSKVRRPMPRRTGKIDGPGGPTDDQVPAMLSDGEFVMNADAVKHFGLDKLNKMNQKGLEIRRGIQR